ncbi:hypothetical protein [Candidatus Amarolinea dominans]|uniref:hypothetical protein n=1 Tax=Candidatus Amarolinea dominans TaxID=3140696 RepID=UPI001DA807B3|nr:hypothetical protein [Anaerolineae bacterium]
MARKSRLRAISQEFNQDVGEAEQVFEIVENQQEFVRLKEFTELRFGTICAWREGAKGNIVQRDLHATEEMDFELLHHGVPQ